MRKRTNLPPYVLREVTRHGKIVFYFRRKGEKRTRLPYPNYPNDPEFTSAYVKAYAGIPVDSLVIKPPTKEPKTLRWLIEKYRQTAHWEGLALNTRKSADTYFDQVIQKSGSFDYRKITPQHIRQGLEKRKHIPSSAVLFLSYMRVLFKWALKNGYINTDPCLGIENPKYKTDGFKPWTIEDLQKFQSFWTEVTMPRLAFEFLLYTGLRCSDACRAGYQHLKGNILTIQTKKVGTIVTVELPDSFMKLLEITPTSKDTFFMNRDKETMNAQQFSIWFANHARKAEIKKSAHGVLNLSATLSAEAGATTHELMAGYG